ncbi:MAG TPA: cupin domain-containing protein [Casimicrobiaceae bacterium]|nr:cupin domain-containing protein [Casimicrobiaceae bacterium]
MTHQRTTLAVVSPLRDNAGPPWEGHDMLVNKSADREWKPTDYAGIERSLFRNNDGGGRSSVVRLVQGSRFPRHAHHGTEEVVVLAGLVSIGGVSLAAGDYLYTEPGEEHDVVALADATIFVSSQKGTPIIEPVDE